MSRFKKIKKNAGFFIKTILTSLVIGGMLCSNVLAVTQVGNGFVEYHTEASINFNEVIEVTLKDKENDYYYTHSLYRVNNYEANMSIPLGTYSITAAVVSDTGGDVSQYEVSYPEEDIVVKSTRSAVPIVLKVEILTGVAISPDDYSGSSELEDEDTSTSSAVSSEDTASETDEKKTGQTEDGRSLLRSSLSFLVILLLGGLGYLYFKRRHARND